MRSVLFTEFGGPEVLQVGEVEEPHAGPGQVRIKVKAAGVNQLDWKIRSGGGPRPIEFPFVPGLEVAGVVDEVGPELSGVSVGDEVFGLTEGGIAEYAVMSAFAAKPVTLSWAEASTLATAAETATRTLGQLGLTAGQTLVINGAAGSVGSAATQLAVTAEATVIGTASPSNHDYLRTLGAIPVTYGDGLVDRVQAVAPQGVDLALDAAGHGALPDLIALTTSPANVLTIADMTANQNGVRFSGGGPGQRFDALETVAKLVDADRFRVLAGPTFTMEEAAEAHRISQDGHANGKPSIVVS